LVGIELPRKDREIVEFREILDRGDMSAPLSTVLGADVDGNPITVDLSKMPHLLVAGATGSGKSVFINTVLCSVLERMSPKDVQMVLIDPKQVELSVYKNAPHLAYPIVTDPSEAKGALRFVVDEMDNRYAKLSRYGVRNIGEFNSRVASGTIPEPKMPLWLVVIDELADLMMVARRDVEKSIVRITQLARAAGIHLIVATQRPSVDVITGLIKANMPSRLAFAVSSKTDSRVILDQMGAETLTGYGDALFIPQGSRHAQRIQGAYISSEEVEYVVSAWKGYGDVKPVKINPSHMIQLKDVVANSMYVSESMVQRMFGVDNRTAKSMVDSLGADMMRF
jgi:S-DNA-T family DNA segregation ATPase FtsK/SpoIIIE